MVACGGWYATGTFVSIKNRTAPVMMKDIPINTVSFLLLEPFLTPEGGRGIVLFFIYIRGMTMGMSDEIISLIL